MVKTLGPFNASALQLLASLSGWKDLGDDREGSFAFNRISVLVLQHFNAVLLHDRLLACLRLQGLVTWTHFCSFS